jgi:hypothetical protein
VAALLAFVFAAAACMSSRQNKEVDLDAARRFERYPLYWLGENFEGWQLEHNDVRPGTFSVFVYGADRTGT